jgi:hypothetical protein
MFGLYNNFGALFQDTAHYIGLLIRKNMVLNSQMEDLAQSHSELKSMLKDAEEAYENSIKSIAEKERVIEDL